MTDRKAAMGPRDSVSIKDQVYVVLHKEPTPPPAEEIIRKAEEQFRSERGKSGALATNEIYDEDKRNIQRAVDVMDWDTFKGTTYRELFTQAGVWAIAGGYSGLRAPKNWIKELLPPKIHTRLSRRGRRKK